MNGDYDTVRALVREHRDPTLMFLYDAIYHHLEANGDCLLTNAGAGELCCVSGATIRRKMPLLEAAGLIERQPVHLGVNNTPYRYSLPKRGDKLSGPLGDKLSGPLGDNLSPDLEEEEGLPSIQEGEIDVGTPQVKLAYAVGVRGEQLRRVAGMPLQAVQEAARRTQANATTNPPGYFYAALHSLGVQSSSSKLVQVTRRQFQPGQSHQPPIGPRIYPDGDPAPPPDNEPSDEGEADTDPPPAPRPAARTPMRRPEPIRPDGVSDAVWGAWSTARGQLKAQFSVSQWEAWLAPLQLAGCVDGTYTLAAPDARTRWMCAGRLHRNIRRVLSDAHGEHEDITIAYEIST